MMTFIEYNNNDIEKIKVKMNSYIKWVLKTMTIETPHKNVDVKGEVKFELPTG